MEIETNCESGEEGEKCWTVQKVLNWTDDPKKTKYDPKKLNMIQKRSKYRSKSVRKKVFAPCDGENGEEKPPEVSSHLLWPDKICDHINSLTILMICVAGKVKSMKKV